MHRINKLTIGSEMFAKKIASCNCASPFVVLFIYLPDWIEKFPHSFKENSDTKKSNNHIQHSMGEGDVFFRNLKDSGCKMLIMLHTLIFSLLHVTMNLRRKFFTSWEMMIKISAQTQREIHVCIKKEKEQEAKFIVFSCECNILSHLILHFVLLHLNRNKFLNRGTHGPCGEC